MLDEILNLVKEQLGNHPDVAGALPAGQADAVHAEVANHIANGLASQGAGGIGGLLGNLQNTIASGGSITSAIEGGLVNSLTSKFGLPPSITGAISGALPGILQKFASKQ
ncbi:MAG: hypothetical protein JST58_14380 [Bacteroidetes bacterium]|nr:hypothetical protein [Bacteroidota bacterium]